MVRQNIMVGSALTEGAYLWQSGNNERKHVKRAGQDITRSQLPSPSEAPSSVVLAALTCSIYSTYGLVRTPGNTSLPEIPSADNQDVSP